MKPAPSRLVPPPVGPWHSRPRLWRWRYPQRSHIDLGPARCGRRRRPGHGRHCGAPLLVEPHRLVRIDRSRRLRYRWRWKLPRDEPLTLTRLPSHLQPELRCLLTTELMFLRFSLRDFRLLLLACCRCLLRFLGLHTLLISQADLLEALHGIGRHPERRNVARAVMHRYVITNHIIILQSLRQRLII